MRQHHEIFIAAMLLALTIGASALESIEIRGPVATVVDGEAYSWGQDQFSGDFSGFYYDINNDLGTESITMNINEDRLEGYSVPRGVQYRTDAEGKRFKFRDWGGYRSIGFMGEEYFVGYSLERYGDEEPYLASIYGDYSLLKDEFLLKVLKDDDSEIIISPVSPLLLEEGYELRVRSVDILGNRAYLELYRNGRLVDEGVVMPSEVGASMADKTYCFHQSFSVGGSAGRDIVVIAVHFKNAFRAPEVDAATVDGVFQLSGQPNRISENDEYGDMTVTRVTEESIVLDNLDRTISLSRSRNIPLMMGIRIRTADQNFTDDSPLRFYIFKKITEQGIYEVRGRVAEVVDGRTSEWDAANFPGFFYDLDEDLGREEITIKTTGEPDDGRALKGSIIYRTSALEKTFNKDIWGRYYSVGFMGENYFAGYLEGAPETASLFCAFSDENNLLADEKLSRVLIDTDEERPPLATGSILRLEEGYELLIKGVDVNGMKVHLGLRKEGSGLDDKIVVLDEEMSTYYYKIPLGPENSNKIVSIAVHFKNAYHGTEADMTTVDGIWQISDGFLTVSEGLDFDKMTIDRISSREGDMAIEIINDDDIPLRKDRLIRLMGEFCIRTADQDKVDRTDPLRYYVLREMTIEEGAIEEKIGPPEEIRPKDEGPPIEEMTKIPTPENKLPGFQVALALIAVAAVFLERRRRG